MPTTSFRFDPDAYFARIGLDVPADARTADLTLLRAIIRAHAETISFENLAVVDRQPVSVEPADIFAKLVTARRGGYCFEQNGLLEMALQTLGFTVRSLSGRVRARVSDRAIRPPRTHLALAATVAGADWLCDVGFGNYTLTEPLPLIAGHAQDTRQGRRRLIAEGERWFQQLWQDGDWLDLYEFEDRPMYPSDRKVANWYTSTHPDSPFMNMLMVARPLATGGQLTLIDDQLRRRSATGEMTVETIAPADLAHVLNQSFGLTR